MVSSTAMIGADPVAPEQDGFEAFYRANADRIYRALAVTLRRDDLAADAVAEAMSRAYARWPTVSRLDNPAGWVFRVALNWATSWWRKVRRERPPADDSAHPHLWPPEITVARDALAELPEPQRAVITCRVLLDLSTADTAAVTTGRLIAKLSLPGTRCLAVSDLRLSPISTPERAVLAVAYDLETADHLLESRVALIEVATGRRLADHEVAPVATKSSPGISLAWQDERTLRGASYPVDPAGVGEVNGFTLNAK